MIKYDQLISGGKDSDGDCFRACIATVLQLPIETLPNWHDNMWFLKWDNWLHERGLGITVHSFYYGVDGYWIASVKSQNYKDTTHAVVMNDEKLFHDPSPVKKFKSISDDDILASYHIGLTNIDKLIQTEIAEAERRAGKAFGGCTKCYGKGYSTSISYNAGGGKKWRKPLINYCTCERGKQLEQLTEIEV